MELVEDDERCTPADVKEQAASAIAGLLPDASRVRYERAYATYLAWCSEQDVSNNASESALLACFSGLRGRYASSSLWSIYSMLKVMIRVNPNVDIGNLLLLTHWLKENSKGHEKQVTTNGWL